MYVYGISTRTFNSTLLGYEVTGEGDALQEKHTPQVSREVKWKRLFFSF